MTDQKYALVLHRDSEARRVGERELRAYASLIDGELDHIMPINDEGLEEIVNGLYLVIDGRVPAGARKTAKLGMIRGLFQYARDGREVHYLMGQAIKLLGMDGDPEDMTPRMTRVGGDGQGNVYDAEFVVKKDPE